MQNIFFFIFSQILALSLDFSRMTLLLVATEPVPKIGHNFDLCSLPYVLQFSTVLLENPLHSTNISWNSPYCSPSVIPANLTTNVICRNLGLEVRSPLSPQIFVLICILSCLKIDSAVSLSFFFFSFARNFSAVLCVVGVQQQSHFCSTV